MEPACTCRIWNHAVFPFYAMVVAPVQEFCDKRIRNFPGKFSPVLLIVVREYFLKLRDPIMGHIDQSGAVVDDKTYGYAIQGIEYFWFPGSGGPPSRCDQRSCQCRGMPYKSSSVHIFKIMLVKITQIILKTSKHTIPNHVPPIA